MAEAAELEKLKAENVEFFEKTATALRELFDQAKAANELQFALSLMPEFRGSQADGWNTAIEAQLAFDEYLSFLRDGEFTSLKARVALAFYCHIAEASGFYEIPKNMLRVAGGGFHNPWPFQSLVESHRVSGNAIAPNANRIIRDLTGHAETLGLHCLAEVFRVAFDSDLRNGFSHADYIVWNDGIRLRKRNGGNPKLVPWIKFNQHFERGINFFHILRNLVEEYIRSYSPAKTVTGRYSDGRVAECTIAFDEARESFKITDSAP